MARQYLHRVGFVDGVKPSYNPIAIPRSAIWEARNVDVSDEGVLRIRPGSATYTPSLGNGAIQGSISAFDTILAVWDGSLYKLVDGAWSAIRESFLAAGDVSMELWSESNSPVVYLHDGNGIWKTDGSTCDRITPYTPGAEEPVNLLRAGDGSQDLTHGTAKAKIALFKHGLASRLALAYENSVFLSHSYDPSYFPDNQVIQLPDDGGTVVALKLFYDALIIFRDKDIWAFFGDDVTTAQAFDIQDSSVGCFAPKSIAHVPGVGLVFVGPDNIYTLQGVTAVSDQYHAVPIADDIVPYLSRTMASDGVATFYNREYILSFPNAVEPERVFRFKANKKAWYIDSGPRPKDWIKHNGNLYFTSRSFGFISERSSEYRTDDGSTIPFLAKFAHERLSNGPARIKKIFIYVNSRDTLQHLDVAVIADGRQIQTIELDISAQSGADFIIGRSAIGVGRIGRMSEVKIYEGKVNLKGTFAQVRIIANTPNEDIGIIGYSLEYRAKAKMKGLREGVKIDG